MIGGVTPWMDRTVHTLCALRRMRLSLLLPLMLALCQHGAWLHELSHVAYAATVHQTSVHQAQGSIENGVCPTCQSFGQLGSALSSASVPLVAAVSNVCPHSAPQYSQHCAPRTTPRNRGPPQLI